MLRHFTGLLHNLLLNFMVTPGVSQLVVNYFKVQILHQLGFQYNNELTMHYKMQ